jgi:carbon storage regulator CsrA
MLVFTRREGEEVIIGDPSNPLGVVRIASIRGDRVRIAFDFPREIRIDRKEVADNKKAAADSAATASSAEGSAPSQVDPAAQVNEPPSVIAKIGQRKVAGS